MSLVSLLRDPSSHSNPDEARVTHLSWDAVVDFDQRKFFATATYDVDTINNNCSTLRLDTSKLDVQSVTVNGSPATFSISLPNLKKLHLGSCLEIDLRSGSSSIGGGGGNSSNTNFDTEGRPEKEVISVSIQYSTSPNASAVQWLPPSQTSGKEYPYVFTQCQAIHARTLLPCQDCPAVKMTYEARVTVPHWATAVMSALPKDGCGPNSIGDSAEGGSSGDHITFEFNQWVPIPSYLFALAVGNLKSIDISPRCRVWSEPTMVDAVAYEFSQVEDFLSAAEEVTGVPYQWGRYDLLCLPPSFPYGGMENPCLTFVTPTLLVGDKSLADVVAHEAAHSWSGNLVTNRSWKHFWLNEGWTVFLERKIMTKVNGNPKYFDFHALGGWAHLVEDIALKPDKFTKLVPDLHDGDPDDSFSSVPYEKGFNLLYALEKTVGEEQFSGFIHAYFDHFKFSTVDTADFIEYLESYFMGLDASIAEIIKGFDLDMWLNKPGLPPMPNFDRTLSAECERLANAWISVDYEMSTDGMSAALDISAWSSQQKTCFLDCLINKCTVRQRPLSLKTLGGIKNAYAFHQSRNSEILYRYCILAIEAEDVTILPVVIKFITTQGRMKFVRPLYRSLFQSKIGKELAVSTFTKNIDFYHPIAAKMIATDIDEGMKKEVKSFFREQMKSFFREPLVVVGLLALSSAIAVALLRGKRR